MGREISAAELCERYSNLYTGAITDVLDTEFGTYDQTMDKRIEPLTQGMSCVGIAFPVVGRPNRSVDPDENVANILTMLGEAPEDAVLTYQTNDTEAAHLGELSTTALEAQGCNGAVVDGCVRDVSQMLEQGFPVHTRYKTPADALPRWEILDWNVTAVVGGVEVHPRDIVVADADGVVVIPRELALDVLEAAEELASSEDEVREAVENGTAPLAAYNEHGTF